MIFKALKSIIKGLFSPSTQAASPNSLNRLVRSSLSASENLEIILQSGRETKEKTKSKKKSKNKKSNSDPSIQPIPSRPHEFLAIDCEMVGVGYNKMRSALARVSLVDFNGRIILDRLVKPTEPITQYRTRIHGIRPKDLKNATPFQSIKPKVARLVKDKILIGHAIKHDLDVLPLQHPPEMIRDTSTYQPLRTLAGTSRPSLKRLAHLLLGLKIQDPIHSSVDDARATMAIYRTQQDEWEKEIQLLRQQQHQQKKDKEDGQPGEPSLDWSSTDRPPLLIIDPSPPPPPAAVEAAPSMIINTESKTTPESSTGAL